MSFAMCQNNSLEIVLMLTIRAFLLAKDSFPYHTIKIKIRTSHYIYKGSHLVLYNNMTSIRRFTGRLLTGLLTCLGLLIRFLYRYLVQCSLHARTLELYRPTDRILTSLIISDMLSLEAVSCLEKAVLCALALALLVLVKSRSCLVSRQGVHVNVNIC